MQCGKRPDGFCNLYVPSANFIHLNPTYFALADKESMQKKRIIKIVHFTASYFFILAGLIQVSEGYIKNSVPCVDLYGCEVCVWEQGIKQN
jgi:hypothetical protein